MEKWLLQVQDVMLVSIRDIIERAIQVGSLFDVWLVEHVSYHLACQHKGYHGASCICGGVSLSYWLQCNAHCFCFDVSAGLCYR